jgi:hypothetical protein
MSQENREACQVAGIRRGGSVLQKLAVAVALAIAPLGLAATAVAAPPPAQDSVTGSISYGEGRGALGFTFSGPAAANPTGTVTIFTFISGDLGTFAVSCLGVSGNRGTIVAPFPGTAPPTPAGVVIHVEDNGSSGDRVDSTFVSTLPTSCPPPATVLEDPNTFGDVTVVDAPPPPALYADCRQAGWVKYGFASHAACIGYVHERARQACTFERVAHGVSAFRLKYGLGPTHDHAMRHCVRLHTGF